MKTIAKLCAIVVLAIGSLVSGQTPFRDKGASVTGAFEGWFTNPDGSFSLLFGYYNRNLTQEPDVPIGPNNRIEPGGPDRGQPTHFLPGRQYGLFAVRVPADFGKGNRVIWTLVANGQPTTVPGTLHSDYEISSLLNLATGNTPPVVRFDESGPSVQGPLAMTVERTASVAMPLTITVHGTDDAKRPAESRARERSPLSFRWIRFRVPGSVAFEKERTDVETIEGGSAGQPFRGKSTSRITFAAPGDYVLALVANDYSREGGGGSQCCWTTAHLKVAVKP